MNTINILHFMTYEFRFAFGFMKNILNIYINSGDTTVQRFKSPDVLVSKG